MVFCYKLLSESPRRERSGNASPRKRSPCRSPNLSSSISELIKTIDFLAPGSSNVINDIPEHEWRLLETLVRKRNLEYEREKLSDQLKKTWEKEQEEKNLISTECSEQYRRFLLDKREQEQMLHKYKTSLREYEYNMKQKHLQDYIRHKDIRSSNWLHSIQDRKAQLVNEKAICLETKALRAIDRKMRYEIEEQWKRDMELDQKLKRVETARQKKEALLKDTSKRIAINNALNYWESAIIKHEFEVMNEFKRAEHLASVQLTNRRNERLAQEKRLREERARRVATLSAQLRSCVMRGNLRS